MASASAASALSGTARGRSRATMALIWTLSPWPAPTTVFLTAFGAYSAMVTPSRDGHQHGDATRLAELQRGRGVAVDEGLLDGGFHRREPRQHLLKPVEQLTEPDAERLAVIGADRAAGDVGEPHPVGINDSPPRAAEPRVDADDANRFASHAHVISRVGRLATIEEGENPPPPTSGRRWRTGPRPTHRGGA